jgi:hypothetical protein
LGVEGECSIDVSCIGKALRYASQSLDGSFSCPL